MTTNAGAPDGFESGVATIAFVDLAGFSAIADVYGDASAIAILGHFEGLVREAMGDLGRRSSGSATKRCSGFPIRQRRCRCSGACSPPAAPSHGFL
jgi:hypothetical protein